MVRCGRIFGPGACISLGIRGRFAGSAAIAGFGVTLRGPERGRKRPGSRPEAPRKVVLGVRKVGCRSQRFQPRQRQLALIEPAGEQRLKLDQARQARLIVGQVPIEDQLVDKARAHAEASAEARRTQPATEAEAEVRVTVKSGV